MSPLKRYRIVLICVLFAVIVFTVTTYIYDISSSLPESLKVMVGDDSLFEFDLPVEAEVFNSAPTLKINNSCSNEEGHIHFSMSEPFTVKSETVGSFKTKLKLFGLFELKNISIDIIDEMKLKPCGNAIGIHVDTDGLLVLGTGIVKGIDGLEYEPAYNIIQSGDYICGINGNKVNSIDGLVDELQNCKGKKAKLDILRNEVKSKISIPIVCAADGTNKVGVWVREDTQGIGTMTYITQNETYGALGHGVADVDTGVLLRLKEGNIYNTEIIQVIKGSAGNPGEIMGMILESSSQNIGSITENSETGISGIVKNESTIPENEYDYIPIALRQEIKEAPATILSQIGDEVKEYGIRITDVRKGNNDNKGMIIEITDERLLDKTGGIVQGMSGSPIIQDGKLVGAVTHVFVDDPTKGYGIFIEDMLR